MEIICKLLPDMLEDKNLTEQEKVLLQLFHDRAAYRLNQIFSSESHHQQLLNTVRMPLNDDTNVEFYAKGVSTIKTIFQDILDDLEINKKSLKKGKGALINAFYICILDMLKGRLATDVFKYPTIEDFLQVYGEKFAKESNKEKQLLWQTANWAHVLFTMTMRGKTNGGLAIDVIPKIVEGWRAKYIVGGGMSSATANRKYLVYTEGNIPMKRPTDSEGSVSDSQAPVSPRKKIRNTSPVIMEEDHFVNSAASSSISYSHEEDLLAQRAPLSASSSFAFQQVHRSIHHSVSTINDKQLDFPQESNHKGGGGRRVVGAEDCLTINPNIFKYDCLLEDSSTHPSILYEDEKVKKHCMCYLHNNTILDTRYCPIHQTTTSSSTSTSPLPGYASMSHLAPVPGAQPTGLPGSQSILRGFMRRLAGVHRILPSFTQGSFHQF
eukprot:gene29957-39133_t